MTERLLASGRQWKAYLSSEGRTAHPYRTEVWGRRVHNHPSIDLVERPETICELPEVKEFPALGCVLFAANVTSQRLRTTACSPGTVDCDPSRNMGFTRAAGALIHIALRDEVLNKQPQNLIDLACGLVQATDWVAAPDLWLRLTVEPYKTWHGMAGFHGLAFEFNALARDDEGAWEKASAYAPVLAAAIAQT